MAKIGLDYGHGNNTFPPDKGVYIDSKGYAEHDFNAKLGLKVKALLEANGHTVIEGQGAYEPDVPLIQRTNLYNRENVDLVWSIHANANGNNGVEGRCAFYWHTADDSKQLAELYVDEVHKAGYDTHGNGLHASKVGSWTNLHICRETNMTAVLTENGFMTNAVPGADDFRLIFGSKQEEYTDEMALVHVKAIQRFLGEDFKDTGTKTHTPDEQQTKSHSTNKGTYKGNSVVDYLKHMGEDSSFSHRAELAKEYGVSGYKGTAAQNTELLDKLQGGSKPGGGSNNKSGGKYGKLKIVNVSNAAIVMDAPDRINASNIGTIAKGHTASLNGSVRGKNNSGGYWEIEYDGGLGYVTAKYGKRV